MPETPPANWLTYHLLHPGPGGAMPGDPNCAFYWKGRYHLHYIYNHRAGFAFAHVSSDDLVHWKWHPTTLTPGTTGHGMFSGTGFITKEGKPAIIYHGQGSGRNQIAFALDDNLEQWTKPEPIIPKDAAGQEAKMSNWDPDCWLKGDTYYALSGGGNPSLMKSPDLKDWRFLGPLLQRRLSGRPRHAQGGGHFLRQHVQDPETRLQRNLLWVGRLRDPCWAVSPAAMSPWRTSSTNASYPSTPAKISCHLASSTAGSPVRLNHALSAAAISFTRSGFFFATFSISFQSFSRSSNQGTSCGESTSFQRSLTAAAQFGAWSSLVVERRQTRSSQPSGALPVCSNPETSRPVALSILPFAPTSSGPSTIPDMSSGKAPPNQQGPERLCRGL